jgi:hypothetical protein
MLCGAAALGVTDAAFAAGPTAETLPTDATLLSDSYALLSGVVNPHGFNTVYRFQWGKTTAYGNTTPVTQAGNGKADVPVDVSLDALKPNTTYHYRLVASPVKADGDFAYLGDVAGADRSFKTTPSLGVRFKGTSAKVAKTKAKVKLKGVGPAGEKAGGRLTLKARIGKKLRSIGSAKYSIATGRSKTIAVKLSKAARSALAQSGAHTLKVTASAKTNGVKKPVTRKLVLKA